MVPYVDLLKTLCKYFSFIHRNFKLSKMISFDSSTAVGRKRARGDRQIFQYPYCTTQGQSVNKKNKHNLCYVRHINFSADYTKTIYNL